MELSDIATEIKKISKNISLSRKSNQSISMKSASRKSNQSDAFIKAQKLNLSNKEISVLNEYTGGGSLWINNYLRKRNLSGLTTKELDKLKESANVLLNLITRISPSKKPITVYRGAEAMYSEWRNLKKGEELIFTNKGFISTTFNIDTALNFIEDGDDCCLLILHLPKGTRGLYLNSMSLFDDLDEDELLLPHKSKFIIKDVKYIKHNNQKVLTFEATLVSQH